MRPRALAQACPPPCFAPHLPDFALPGEPQSSFKHHFLRHLPAPLPAALRHPQIWSPLLRLPSQATLDLVLPVSLPLPPPQRKEVLRGKDQGVLK